jgi:hypothetical protein
MLVMLVCDVVVAVLFYELFEPVSKTVSLLAMALRLVMTAILGVNLLGRLGPLLMLQDAPVAAAFDTAQTQAAARLVLVQYELGFTVALVFFGVDCLVVGWMVIRSAFLPAPLGLMLVAAGVCYLTASVADLVFPAFVQPFDVLMVAYAAELALCFWLIVMSVNPELSRGRADAGGWCRSRRAHPAHAAGRVADRAYRSERHRPGAWHERGGEHHRQRSW